MFASWRDRNARTTTTTTTTTTSNHSHTFSKPKLAFPVPSLPTSIPVIIPHRFRRRLQSRLRSRQSPASISLTALRTSFSPADTLRDLQAHRWSFYDAQYLVVFFLLIFSASISPSLWPTILVSLIFTTLLFPITRQFFLPFSPIGAWLIFFFCCRFIPSAYRPSIWVRVLPALEKVFYGANLSNVLSAHKHVVLDVLAWIPYGLTHFGAPAVCSAIMFVFAAPGTVPCFARSFGYLNIIGVMIQLLLPCSPPWYENMYGLAPANYSMEGSPAGLARVDMLLGVDMYTSSFTASPMVFGAFPSLHAGSATMEALFMSHIFPRLTPVFIVYTCWIWWATMYLSHHYAVDLVGGSLLAGVLFYVTKAKFLPRQQPDKDFRWDYDYVERGDKSSRYEYGLADLDVHVPSSEDDWTVGSSSSVSSAGSGSGSGSASPIDEGQSIWEGETLASHSDNDSYELSKDANRR